MNHFVELYFFGDLPKFFIRPSEISYIPSVYPNCTSYNGEDENGAPLYITHWEIPRANISISSFIESLGNDVLRCSKLDQSNVVPVKSVAYRLDMNNLHVYLASEFVNGFSFRVLSQLRRKWTTQQVAQFCYEVIEAMIYLERECIRHGNINDSSIFLDNNGAWRIADFLIVPHLIWCAAPSGPRFAAPSTDQYDVKQDLCAFAKLIDSTGNRSSLVQDFVEKCKMANSFFDLKPLNLELIRDRYKLYGNFRVVCLLGMGTFGEVYKVEDLLIEKEFALKRIKCENEANGMEEAKVLAHLDHKNIVRYYGSWTETMNLLEYISFFNTTPMEVDDDNGVRTEVDVTYIQMELCDRDLKKKLESEKFTDNEQIKRIFIGIANGLKFIHSRGIIHRDLKPANIFLKNDTVKIGDFGIFTTRGSRSTTQAGTRLYMAPEVGKKEIKARADMYSLGIILFEMCLTSSKGKDRKDVIKEIRRIGAPIEGYVMKSHEFYAIMKNLLNHEVDRRFTATQLLRKFPDYKRMLDSISSGSTRTPK